MNADVAPGTSLSSAQFESLFPFYVAIDRELRIIRAGRSFRRLCGDVPLGTPLTAAFCLKRPFLPPGFEALSRAEGKLLLWQRLGSDLTLRGHVLRVGVADSLLVLWSPWLSDTAEIGRYGLAVDDFPLHDPVIDLLHVVKSHTMALADVKKLAEKLTVQRAQLRATNAELQQQYELLKEAQRRLQGKEAETRKLALIASRTDNGVVLTDALGRTEWVNDGFIRMTGYTLDEMRDRTPGSVLQGSGTDRDTVARIRAQLRSGQGFRCELLNYHKSGREFWVAIEVQPIRDDAGEIVNFMGIETDVTERRLSAAALEASEVRYRSLVGSLREVVFQTDPSGCLTFINPAWTRITGLSVEESLGKTIVSFLHPDDRARFRRLLAGLIDRNGGESFLDECRLRMHPQRYGWVEFSAHASVEPNGITGTLNDITERRKAAQIMLDAARAAEAANRAKSEFLATMSHEIRTPMNGVLGMAELLSHTALQADQRALVETIHTSSSALLRIINDILDFSKVESGTMSFEDTNFDLNSLIGEALDVVRPEARRKGLQLYFSFDQHIDGPVRGDAGRLRQILLNLLSNAVKFTDQGGVTLRAIRLNPHRAAVTVRFEVLDTGPGIPEREQACLFQPFSQCDATPSRRYGGTGLGLAISRRLVQLMNGDIGVESAVGKGSCFWFQLPLMAAPPSGPPADLNMFHGTRAYLVIRHAEVLDALRASLASWSVECQSAASLADAVADCLRTAVPDDSSAPRGIILVEQGAMSIQDASLIRNAGCARLVLLTNPGDLPDEHDELDALVDAYLVTPVGRSQLFDCLSTLIRQSDRATVAAETPPEDSRMPAREKTLPPASERGRVLLVEDNEVNRRVALMMLEKLAWQVDCAEDGRQALELMQGERYAVVFMDCQMPVMDGFQATRAIRRREQADSGLGHTHIVAVTANALSGDREQCLAAGMDDYLSKPLSLDKLREVLARCRAQRGMDGPGGPSAPDSGAAPQPDRTAEDSPARIDRAVLTGLLEDLGDDGAAVFDQILDVFLADTPVTLGELRQAVTVGELDRAAKIAHRLKGSSAQMGAQALAGCARRIEVLAAEGTAPGLTGLIAEIDGEWAVTASELEIWRRARTAAGPASTERS